MRAKLALSLLPLLFIARPADATIIVIGGIAQSCYEAADQNRRDAVHLCTLALDGQAMSPRDRAATYINRSYALLMANRPREAISDSQAALRLDPRLGEGYLNHGVALAKLKRPSEAMPLINKSIEVGFDKIYLAYFNRAYVKEDLGDVRGAYEDYKKALEIEPKFTYAADELTRFKVVTR